MENYIWDKINGYKADALAEIVRKESKNFSNMMLQTVSYSLDKEAIELISNDSMKRFCILSEKMASELDSIIDEYDPLENNYQNTSLLTSWIILGSLTETVLQIFLAFYISDYKDSQWKQWTNFKKEEVNNKIYSSIKELIDKKIIDNEQGKSLKNAIKSTIKKHCTEHPVQRIMLDELIQFYKEQELLDNDEIKLLRKIQSNRNGIHSFENRTLDGFEEIILAVKFWCYLLEWILLRLPDIPDY